MHLVLCAVACVVRTQIPSLAVRESREKRNIPKKVAPKEKDCR